MEEDAAKTDLISAKVEGGGDFKEHNISAAFKEEMSLKSGKKTHWNPGNTHTSLGIEGREGYHLSLCQLSNFGL